MGYFEGAPFPGPIGLGTPAVSASLCAGGESLFTQCLLAARPSPLAHYTSLSWFYQ